MQQAAPSDRVVVAQNHGRASVYHSYTISQSVHTSFRRVSFERGLQCTQNLILYMEVCFCVSWIRQQDKVHFGHHNIQYTSLLRQIRLRRFKRIKRRHNIHSERAFKALKLQANYDVTTLAPCMTS